MCQSLMGYTMPDGTIVYVADAEEYQKIISSQDIVQKRNDDTSKANSSAKIENNVRE